MSPDRILLKLPFKSRQEKNGQVLLSWPTESRRSPEELINRFDLPQSAEESLDENERKIMDHLVKAASGFASVFAVQDAAEESSFYPLGTTREQIIQADKENPDANIRSPYTVIEINSDGRWVARPMHEVYAQFINNNRVLEHMRDAASLVKKGSGNSEALKTYLQAREKAFETGDFEPSERFQITLDAEPKISMDIGFGDVNSDEKMGEKSGAQAWVTVLDEQITEVAKRYVEVFQRWRRQKTHRPVGKVRVRAAYPKVITGQAALYGLSANSYPCPEEWRAQMGSKIHLFLTQIEENNKRKIPVMKQLGTLYDITDEQIQDLGYQQLVYHEAAHSEIPIGIKKRLGRLAQPVKELYCDLLALEAIYDTSTEQYVKDMALLSIFADGLLGYVDYLAQRKRPMYYVDTSTILGYCVQNGAVEVSRNGIPWERTERVYDHLRILRRKVDFLLSRGTLESAQRLFDSYFHPDIYGPLVHFANDAPTFLSNEPPNEPSFVTP